MTLRGALDAFPLETVLQLLAVTAKTGELEARDQERVAILSLSGGRLVSAKYEDESGDLALGAAFAIRSGDFEFIPMGSVGDADLQGDLDALLDRAVEHRDRLIAMRELIPHDGVRFKLSDRAAAREEIRLSPDEWRALLAAEGQDDVAGIASRLGLKRLRTRELVAGLVGKGLVDVVHPLGSERAARTDGTTGRMRPLGRSASGEPVELRGSMPDLPLDPVVQLCAATARTGRIEVRAGRDVHVLGLEGGRLVSASSSGETGESALGEIMAVETGEFEFIPMAAAPAHDLEGDVEELLARAGKDRERILADRALIPSDRMRFRLSERAAGTGEIRLDPAQWRAVFAANGERDVAAMAELLGLRRLAAVKLLADLVRRGAIDAVDAPAEATEAAMAASAPAAMEAAPAEVETPLAETPIDREAETVVDDRLAALAGIFGPAEPAPPPPAWEPPPAEVVTPGTPPVAEQVAAVPAEVVVPPEPVAPPVEPLKKGGLFGRFGRTPASIGVAPSGAPAAASRAGRLAQFANDLVDAYSSGRYSKARIDSAIRPWVMRADEQADPLDRPIPLAADRLDVAAIERELPEKQAVPYVALLIREVHSEAERVLGKDSAKRAYRETRARVFGKDLSVLQQPDAAARLPKV
ncbi:MAG: DUF4388 domain-containing protein [Chloroflexi bacterium]|nr:DUF4388 domain-containing protein [Chloroflexota bacterium]